MGRFLGRTTSRKLGSQINFVIPTKVLERLILEYIATNPDDLQHKAVSVAREVEPQVPAVHLPIERGEAANQPRLPGPTEPPWPPPPSDQSPPPVVFEPAISGVDPMIAVGKN
jgi:hypothetical protein